MNERARTPHPAGDELPASAMPNLVLGLVRPYRGWLAVVFLAMIVETLISLAAPWPLKLVLDDALGHRHLPEALAWVHDWGIDRNAVGVALFAGILTVPIAAIGAVASYVDNYYTESVGQWVANDLRTRMYEHMHRLSLAYYDHAQTGALMSTITNDVSTVQGFASSLMLGILVDLMTIAGMLVLMFWLEWDFALIAVGVTPFLLLFVMRFKKVVKEADAQRSQAPERHRRGGRAGTGLGAGGQGVWRQDVEARRMEGSQPRDRSRPRSPRVA